jgi:hypothetical protein
MTLCCWVTRDFPNVFPPPPPPPPPQKSRKPFTERHSIMLQKDAIISASISYHELRPNTGQSLCTTANTYGSHNCCSGLTFFRHSLQAPFNSSLPDLSIIPDLLLLKGLPSICCDTGKHRPDVTSIGKPTVSPG